MSHRSTSRGAHRRAALVVTAVSSVALLAACGGSTQPADGSGSGSDSSAKTLVFSPLGLQIPAMKQLSDGIKAYAASKGFDVIVQDPGLDAQKQVTDLQSVVQSGRADAVWAIMVQPSSATALVGEAQDAGVPMVLNGVPADYGLDGLVPGVSFATIDYTALGKAAGEALGTCINDELDGKAQVIMEESTPGTAGKEDIETAAKDALAATAPGAEIVTSVVASERSQAQTDIGAALQGNPEVTAVLGNNDEGSLGAIGAFKAAGKELPCIVDTGGGNDESLASVDSGDLYAVVALQFQDDMTQNVDQLASMVADPTAQGVQLTTPQKVVTGKG